MATEETETVRKASVDRRLRLAADIRQDSEPGMKNTVYVKDVESVIVQEPNESLIGQPHESSKLRDLVQPTEFRESILQDKEKAADQINSEFIRLMKERQLNQKTTSLPAKTGEIYQLFFESVETLKTHEKNEYSKGQRIPVMAQGSRQQSNEIQKPMKSSDGGSGVLAASAQASAIDPEIARKLDPRGKALQPMQQTVHKLLQFETFSKPFTAETKSELRPFPDVPEDPEAFLYDYIRLPNNPIFKTGESLMSLKATSFFNDSVLFENDLITVACQTILSNDSQAPHLTLHLTFQAKVPNLRLSSYLDTVDTITAEPLVLSDKPLTKPVTQTFVLKFNVRQKVIDFPTLKISLRSAISVKTFSLLVPFSVNKFFHEIKSPKAIMHAYKHVSSKEQNILTTLIFCEFGDGWRTEQPPTMVQSTIGFQ